MLCPLLLISELILIYQVIQVGHDQFSHLLTREVQGGDNHGLCCVETIAIVSFLAWLTRWIVLEVFSTVLLVRHLVMSTPPYANFLLMMSIVSTGIVDVYLARLLVCADIGFPQVAMDQRWLDSPAACHEGIQQSRDEFIQGDLNNIIKFLRVSVRCFFDLINVVHKAPEVRCPAAVPRCVERIFPIECRALEPKFTGRRLAAQMELC